MRLRVYSEVWHGRRYWSYRVYDPSAPVGNQWRRSGGGKSSWREALTDGCAALQQLTKKAGA